MDRSIIESIPHIGEIHAQHGEFKGALPQATRTFSERMLTMNRIAPSIEEAIRRVGLKDGMTISFHHHFRNGDYIVNLVMDVIARMGIKNLTVAASSLNDVHSPLIGHIENGVVSHIETSGMRGELADRISHGLMDFPVVFRSHGGRAAAIESGELQIDVAFLGAPSCDPYGNANGYSREQDNAASCGSLGYAKLDAMYAKHTIILTDHIVRFPNAPFGIPESNVEYVVKVDAIGDAQGIMSGATRFTKNPKELLIAKTAADVIEASGYFYDGFSMQMGSGGASLATARFLREKMEKNNLKCRFALGGITGQIVEMHEAGLIERILDVQSFDLVAAESLKNNRFHQQIDASYYASIVNEGAAVNQLDFVVLSALEVDTDFNVNVLTGSDGVIRGAIGGHPDTADGASLAVVVCPLTRGRIPSIVKKVNTRVTPGATIDVVVTDQGIAVNPRRPEIRERLIKAGLPVFDIERLEARAERIVGTPAPIQYHERIVGVVMYRDNTIIDVIRQVKDVDV
ncbi:MAG: citrate lyase subunit alpha [Clostridia bacterium]|nr:citrate lyase subunit alpha [Clostridia bacterium]